MTRDQAERIASRELRIREFIINCDCTTVDGWTYLNVMLPGTPEHKHLEELETQMRARAEVILAIEGYHPT